MITPVGETGRNFKAAIHYITTDKNKDGDDRVAWAKTNNMVTKDPALAHKEMSYTFYNNDVLKSNAGIPLSGQKVKKPCFMMALSWHPEQDPDDLHIEATGHVCLAHLGLNEHESVFAMHTDRGHKHLHIVVNTIHPTTGKVQDLWKCKRELSKFALGYEIADGRIYCHQRLENAQKRLKGHDPKYHDPVIQEAWKQSDNGKSFTAALEEKGYSLAQGRRLVIVNKHGDIFPPLRHLEGVKTKDLKNKLSDIDLTKLRNADDLSKEIIDRRKEEYQLSRDHDQNAAREKRQLHGQQLLERQKLTQQFKADLQKTQQAFDQLYQADKLKSKAEQLKKKTNKTPEKFFEKIQTVIYNLTGAKKRDIQKLNNLNKDITEIKKRRKEKELAVEKQKQDAIKEQARKQQLQREFKRKSLDKNKPEYYLDVKPPEKSPEQIQKEQAIVAEKDRQIEAFKEQMRQRNREREISRNQNRGLDLGRS